MTAWPERLVDETGAGISLGDGTGDLILSPVATPTPCVLTFRDVFGNPLPSTMLVAISNPISAPAFAYLGVGSAITLPLSVGVTYFVQYFGALAPPITTTFVAASAVTIVPDRYVSPWANLQGYAVQQGALWPLGRTAGSALLPGGGVRVMLETFAAMLAQLDLFHRTIAAGQRLDSSVDGQIDSWVKDFLGDSFPRLAGEDNPTYIARVKAWLQQPFGTLPAVAAAAASFFASFPDGSTSVRVFNRQRDPASSAFYGLQPGQIAILATYATSVPLPAWYIGQSFIGQNTFVSSLTSFTSSQTAPYPLLGQRVNAVKSGGAVPVYITARR